MDSKKKDELVEVLNGYLETINSTVEKELGVKTEFEIVAEESRYARNDWFVSLKEKNNEETTRQLTSTPLLAQLFKKASLWMSLYMKDNWLCFNVRILYDHNYCGGSNGHRLMYFYIDMFTDEVIVEKE